MRRHPISPRFDWQKTVEAQGLLFHSVDERTYWDESAYYAFVPAEIDTIEKATYALNDMCLAAVQHVIDENRLGEFQIPESHHDWVRQSWDRDEVTIYGRFDLAYDGVSPPKLLEYNADTPTSLLEASVIQWFWLKDCFPEADQFNSIHDRLIEAWKRLGTTAVHFSAVGTSQEDFMTVAYLRETARQAGLRDVYLDINQIGFDTRRHVFADLQGRAIQTCFKLYPWEWMVREQFASQLLATPVRWLEPPWKLLLSNKALLVVLWDLFPNSPYLLEADYEPLQGDQVQKPLLSREGANVTITAGGRTIAQTAGDYDGPPVFQRYHRLPDFAGQHPVIGSWLVNGHACGIGIREDAGHITGNTSRFLPHRIA